MNVNFGLFPQLPTDERGRLPRGRDRKAAYAKRALTSLQQWSQTA
jgi:methylenetetrahydrofolate--tRNA-(uracil-5-)-methyltransferase